MPQIFIPLTLSFVYVDYIVSAYFDFDLNRLLFLAGTKLDRM